MCLWHQHSYCLFFPYGNIWLSCSVVAVEQALTVFSGKKIGVWVTSTCILMRAFFLCKMKCVAGKVTSGRKKSMSKKHNVQTWTIFLIRPSWLSFSEFIVGCMRCCGLLENFYGILTAELPLCCLWCVKVFSNSLTILYSMAGDIYSVGWLDVWFWKCVSTDAPIVLVHSLQLKTVFGGCPTH